MSEAPLEFEKQVEHHLSVLRRVRDAPLCGLETSLCPGMWVGEGWEGGWRQMARVGCDEQGLQGGK